MENIQEENESLKRKIKNYRKFITEYKTNLKYNSKKELNLEEKSEEEQSEKSPPYKSNSIVS